MGGTRRLVRVTVRVVEGWFQIEFRENDGSVIYSVLPFGGLLQFLKLLDLARPLVSFSVKLLLSYNKKKLKPVSEHDHSIKPKTDPFKTLKHLVLTWLMQELFLSLSFTLSVVCERARESERIYSHINFYLMAAHSGGSLQRIISFHFKFPVHGHVCRLIKIFLPPWCR